MAGRGEDKPTISSAEVADIMIQGGRFMTITEITLISAEQYPEMTVTRVQITNIVRHFVRSVHASCERQNTVYPHRYCLHGLDEYQFKVRGRTPDYDSLSVTTTSKAIRQAAKNSHREIGLFAHNLFSRMVREREGRSQ